MCGQDKPGGTSPLVSAYDALALHASPSLFRGWVTDLTLLSPPLRILVDYSGYPYNLSIVEAEVEHVGRDYAFNVFILADKSALAAINRALLVRQASFGQFASIRNGPRRDFTSAK